VSSAFYAHESVTHPELDARGEVLERLADLLRERLATGGVRGECNVRRRDNASLARDRAEDERGELGARVRHRERRRARAVLGLHDLVAAELDAVHELLQLVLREPARERVRRLREERDDLGRAQLAGDGRRYAARDAL
jgi:hypothetical protein